MRKARPTVLINFRKNACGGSHSHDRSGRFCYGRLREPYRHLGHRLSWWVIDRASGRGLHCPSVLRVRLWVRAAKAFRVSFLNRRCGL